MGFVPRALRLHRIGKRARPPRIMTESKRRRAVCFDPGSHRDHRSDGASRPIDQSAIVEEPLNGSESNFSESLILAQD